MLGSYQTDLRELSLLQTNWSQQLNPLLKNPITLGTILKSVKLSTGDNTINHTLARTLQGWWVVRMHSAFAQIYDKQDANASPSKTLVLSASAGVTVDIYVF